NPRLRGRTTDLEPGLAVLARHDRLELACGRGPADVLVRLVRGALGVCARAIYAIDGGSRAGADEPPRPIQAAQLRTKWSEPDVRVSSPDADRCGHECPGHPRHRQLTRVPDCVSRPVLQRLRH